MGVSPNIGWRIERDTIELQCIVSRSMRRLDDVIPFRWHTCLVLYRSNFGSVCMPLPFIESQALFEQGKIGVAETFSCLAAMLSDFLFLQGAPHPGGSILPFELSQLKEVFHQRCFPLIKRRHIFFLLMNYEGAFLVDTRFTQKVATRLQNGEEIHERAMMKPRDQRQRVG